MNSQLPREDSTENYSKRFFLSFPKARMTFKKKGAHLQILHMSHVHSILCN